MDDQDVIDYLVAKTNTDIVTSTMSILNGVIDEKSYTDRMDMRSSLSNNGITISPEVCHRDGDPD
jgi:hypothetical protein